MAFKIILVKVIQKCTVWWQPSRHKQLASVLFQFFKLVSILSLLIYSSFISLLVLISSSVTSLCTISAVQSNINKDPKSVASAQTIVFHLSHTMALCLCVLCVIMCIWGCTVTGESICTEVVLFITRQNFNNCN